MWADLTVTVAGTAGAEQEVCLTIASASGTVFALRDVASSTGGGVGSVPGTFYGTVNCAGATATTADAGW